jgi:hypothetical protein
MKFMMQSKRVTLAGAVSALCFVSALGGCAVATGPGFAAVEAPEAQRGQVYIYRPARFFGGFMNHKMSFSGGVIDLNLPNGTYYRFSVPAGYYSATMRQQIGSDCGAVQFNVAEGETVFVENWAYVASSVGVVNTTACRVKIQEREAALKALADTKQLN